MWKVVRYEDNDNVVILKLRKGDDVIESIFLKHHNKTELFIEKGIFFYRRSYVGYLTITDLIETYEMLNSDI